MRYQQVDLPRAMQCKNQDRRKARRAGAVVSQSPLKRFPFRKHNLKVVFMPQYISRVAVVSTRKFESTKHVYFPVETRSVECTKMAGNPAPESFGIHLAFVVFSGVQQDFTPTVGARHHQSIARPVR